MPNITKLYIAGANGFIGKALCAYCEEHDIPYNTITRGNPLIAPVETGSVCIHLANESDLQKVNSDKHYIAESLALSRSLLGLGFSHIIYASSAALYPESTLPQTEKAAITAQDYYSEMKRANEVLFLNTGHSVFRLSNVYGSGMSTHNVLSTILSQLDAPEIKIQNLLPIRDYIAIEDVILAFILGASSDKRGLFNISTGVGTSVKTLLGTVLKHANLGDKIIVQTSQNPVESCKIINPQKALEQLQWKAETPLEQGLQQLLRNKILP